jgi:hypothetical protein
MLNKNKVVPSFKDLYNSTILYNTLGMLLIAIQTSIPSIKTRKTYPGCIRSFKGYPFEGTGDFSSLDYITCVVHDMRRSSVEPWNVMMKKTTQYVFDKIKSAIDGTEKIDLVRGSRARIFDLYYDKYGPGVVQKIDFGYGRTNPKLWGYKQPEKKKRK